MCSVLTGCGSSLSGGDVIKIGVFAPSSGDNGAGGKQEVLGIEYANSVLNTVEIGGKTYTIELEIVDNESSTDKAPSAASTLASAKCNVVLGFYGSAVSIAASDVFAQAGIPVIGASCTNPQVTEGNTHYFRVCYLDPFQGTVLANSLPYGLQRRLEISRALATDPKLLLLDEPAAGMNPSETRSLAEFILQIKEKYGLTVLLIEHHMDLVMQISEQIYVLDFGKLIAQGTPKEIQETKRVIDAYLGVADDA